jgi:hypothetical protein
MAFWAVSADLHTKLGSGTGTRILNLAVNKSAPPVVFRGTCPLESFRTTLGVARRLGWMVCVHALPDIRRGRNHAEYEPPDQEA